MPLQRKALFTPKRIKRIALIAGGFFLFSLTLWAAFRSGMIPEFLRQPAEITFNISLAISALLLMYGVVAPVSMTAHYKASRNQRLRSRVENHFLFRHFIIGTDQENDRENHP